MHSNVGKSSVMNLFHISKLPQNNLMTSVISVYLNFDCHSYTEYT